MCFGNPVKFYKYVFPNFSSAKMQVHNERSTLTRHKRMSEEMNDMGMDMMDEDMSMMCKDMMMEHNCDEKSLFRTYDGMCNNLEMPMWGAAHIKLVRYLNAMYDDMENLGTPKGGYR